MAARKFAFAAAILSLCVSISSQAASTPGAMQSSATEDQKELVAALDRRALQALNQRAEAIKSIASGDQARARQTQVRAQILELIGGLPDRDAPLKAVVTGRFEGPGLRGENIMFESLPGLRVTANFYRPANTQRVPVILAMPGHSENGKEWLAPFAVNMVGRGFAVLAIDFIGEGERLQYPDGKGGSIVGGPTSEHSMDAFATMPVGDNVARYFINDAIRAVDYLTTRSDIDPTRIATYGCSGGGTVAAYLAALDPRIKAAAVACWVSDYASVVPTIGPQEAEQSIPRFIADGLDLADWVELAAPMPYAIISTTEDFFPIEGARSAYSEARRFWSLLDKPDAIEWIVGSGPHGNVIPLHGRIGDFFARALQMPTRNATVGKAASNAVAEPQAELVSVTKGYHDNLGLTKGASRQVTPAGQVSAVEGSTTIQAVNRQRLGMVGFDPGSSDGGKDLDTLKARVRSTAGIEAVPGGHAPAVEVLRSARGPGSTFDLLRFASTTGGFSALSAAPTSRSKRALVLIGDEPVEGQRTRATALARSGWAVLVLQTPGAGDPENKSTQGGDKNILALRAFLVGKTLPGIAADNIIRAIDWLAGQGVGEVGLVASGNATAGALHAAVLDERIKTVTLDRGLISWRAAVSAPMQKNLAAVTVPGALRYYDLPVLITALAPGGSKSSIRWMRWATPFRNRSTTPCPSRFRRACRILAHRPLGSHRRQGTDLELPARLAAARASSPGVRSLGRSRASVARCA